MTLYIHITSPPTSVLSGTIYYIHKLASPLEPYFKNLYQLSAEEKLTEIVYVQTSTCECICF